MASTYSALYKRFNGIDWDTINFIHSHSEYDNYNHWNLSVNSVLENIEQIGTNETLNLISGSNITLAQSGNDVTISASGGTNNYLSGVSFNTGDGIITFSRTGLTNLTVNLDGRYSLSNHSHSNYLATPGAFIYLGTSAAADSTYAIAIGYSANADYDYSIAIGYDATTGASGTGAIAIGRQAVTESVSTYAIAIGYLANGGNDDAISIGPNSDATGNCSIAIGAYAQATADDSIAIGGGTSSTGANASSTYAIAIGKATDATNSFAVAIGYGTQAAYKDIRLGSSTSFVDSIGGPKSWGVYSDERDKADIEKMQTGLEFVLKLKPITYVSNERVNYIPEREDMSPKQLKQYQTFGLTDYDKEAHAAGIKKGSRRVVGFLAQDVYTTLEEIYGSKNYADIVDDNSYKLKEEGLWDDEVENQYRMKMAHIIPFLTLAIQEQQQIINKIIDVLVSKDIAISEELEKIS